MVVKWRLHADSKCLSNAIYRCTKQEQYQPELENKKKLKTWFSTAHLYSNYSWLADFGLFCIAIIDLSNSNHDL